VERVGGATGGAAIACAALCASRAAAQQCQRVESRTNLAELSGQRIRSVEITTENPIQRGLAGTIADPDARIAGFHFYTFNEVERTERWRRATLARLAVPA